MQFLLKLSSYPKQKILMLHDFSGAYLPEVWAYLDTVRVPEAHYDRPALPEPTADKSLAEDVEEHSRLIHSIDLDPPFKYSSDPDLYRETRRQNVEKKRSIERESLGRLHKKYPRAGFDKAMR